VWLLEADWPITEAKMSLNLTTTNDKTKIKHAIGKNFLTLLKFIIIFPHYFFVKKFDKRIVPLRKNILILSIEINKRVTKSIQEIIACFFCFCDYDAVWRFY